MQRLGCVPAAPTWCSWCVPGRKPGTSTNVMIGMLKESQKRMNLHKPNSRIQWSRLIRASGHALTALQNIIRALQYSLCTVSCPPPQPFTVQVCFGCIDCCTISSTATSTEGLVTFNMCAAELLNANARLWSNTLFLLMLPLLGLGLRQPNPRPPPRQPNTSPPHPLSGRDTAAPTCLL